MINAAVYCILRKWHRNLSGSLRQRTLGCLQMAESGRVANVPPGFGMGMDY